MKKYSVKTFSIPRGMNFVAWALVSESEDFEF